MRKMCRKGREFTGVYLKQRQDGKGGGEEGEIQFKVTKKSKGRLLPNKKVFPKEGILTPPRTKPFTTRLGNGGGQLINVDWR